MLITSALSLLVVGAVLALGCDSCFGPSDTLTHERIVRRMQPDAQNATQGPKSPLAWGQVNFLHTTDTHGWLEGHIKEQNYGADWGDFVSFTKRMKRKARELNVDLLLVDTGDLHDGNGLSDTTRPNGLLSLPIFENVDYDLLTIGNHELYLSDIAYLTANQFAKYYGERYVVSNVQIFNNATNQYEDISNRYRYFTTSHGLRIMAFGVLYDFPGSSNASKVTFAADMIKEQWFLDAVNYEEPIDMFIVIGHNPVKGYSNTLTLVYEAIRSQRADTPIQIFGGHTHIRDFAVYDRGATGLESGRYCETLGWLSMSGVKSSTFNGTMVPYGTPNPSQPAINVTNATTVSSYPHGNETSFADLRYSRRYLDWNRITFSTHASGSQSGPFDTPKGLNVSSTIFETRKKLNTTQLYGCAPQTWCVSCRPFEDSGNLYQLLSIAVGDVVVNESRKDTPHIIIVNTGSVRFDLVKGPFTLDDSFIVSPFINTFQYLPLVPWSIAHQLLGVLNAGPIPKRDLETSDFSFNPSFAALGGDDCVDSSSSHHSAMLARRHGSRHELTRGSHIYSRDTLQPGYVTKDDFGTDGDDTPHSSIPYYPQPIDYQSKVSFPTDGSDPDAVDVVFVDFIGKTFIVPALNSLGGNYSAADIQLYTPESFKSNQVLPEYARRHWQENVPNCPVGQGVGF